MYREIASNKRRSVIFIGLFFVIWLAIGAACGFIFKALYRPSANTGAAAVAPAHYGWPRSSSAWSSVASWRSAGSCIL